MQEMTPSPPPPAEERLRAEGHLSACILVASLDYDCSQGCWGPRPVQGAHLLPLSSFVHRTMMLTIGGLSLGAVLAYMHPRSA